MFSVVWPIPRGLQYEEWRHIVDKAVFAPHGGQLKMQKIFCFSQPISPQLVSIDRGNVENFAEIKSCTIFKA